MNSSNKEKTALKSQFRNYKNLFPFYIPAIFFALIFSYLPMMGLIMAFKDNPNLIRYDSAIEGIIKAPFNQLENFKYIFSKPDFLFALKNTLIISFLKIAITFPLPIILSILLTEVRGKKMVKTLEIVMYLPYFLSWVIVDNIFITLFSPSVGLVNNILSTLGFEKVSFVTSNDYFRGTVVFLSAWKDIGWSTLTYIAAIMTIDPALSEAAEIDGASKMQRIMFIIIPGIAATIAVLFILRIGYVMDAGFEQIYILYTPFVQETGDILGTYSFRLIRNSLIPQYSISSAIGMFNSMVALVLVLGGNFLSRKLFHRGIW
jgi:putative aldouronate transport system permease protein